MFSSQGFFNFQALYLIKHYQTVMKKENVWFFAVLREFFILRLACFIFKIVYNSMILCFETLKLHEIYRSEFDSKLY